MPASSFDRVGTPPRYPPFSFAMRLCFQALDVLPCLPTLVNSACFATRHRPMPNVTMPRSLPQHAAVIPIHATLCDIIILPFTAYSCLRSRY